MNTKLINKFGLGNIQCFLSVYSNPYCIRSVESVIVSRLYGTNCNCKEKSSYLLRSEIKNEAIIFNDIRGFSSKSPEDDSHKNTSKEGLSGKNKTSRSEPMNIDHGFLSQLHTAGSSLSNELSRSASSVLPKQSSSSSVPTQNNLAAVDKHETNSVIKKKVKDWSDMFNEWYVMYQDAAGISEVRRAQEKVSGLIDDMSGISSRRRSLQEDISQLQYNLNNVHSRISSSPIYSEEHTLQMEQGRELNQDLQQCKREFELMEGKERDCLTSVMSAIRVSHEMERTQQQHTNYRTLLLSLVSAAIASVVTFITNLKRTRDTNSRIEKTEGHASQLQQEAKLHSASLQQELKTHVTALTDGLLQRLAYLEESFTSDGDVGNDKAHKFKFSRFMPSLSNGTTGNTDEDMESVIRTCLRSELTRQHEDTVKLMKRFIITLRPNVNGDAISDEGLTSFKKSIDELNPVYIPSGSSVYKISGYMAVGAILGTLMAAVIFAGFK